MLSYAELLRQGIEARKLSLNQLVFRLAKDDICIDKAIISKMQNGKHPPAKDEVNIALANILQIDPTELRLAAAKEVIPEALYQLIREAG